MELKELMQTDVDNLAKKQHDKLKEHTISVLKKVLATIQMENYDEINDLTFSSPAGDGYGLDNHCINFDYGDGDQYYERILDIVEVTEILKKLKSKTKNK